MRKKEKYQLLQLEKKYWRAKKQARIWRLQEEKFRGFAQIKTPSESRSLRPRFNKDTLALKKAKNVKHLNMYTS